MAMRCAANLDDYRRNPQDAYVVHQHFCAFHLTSPSALFGVVVWGRPTVADARLIVAAREPELAAGAGGVRHALVLDYRLVEVIDPDAFACLAEWVTRYRGRLGEVTSRAALIKPTDQFAAATVAGFYSVVDPPYPSKLCASVAEAETWLEVPTVAAVEAVYAASAAGRAVTSALSQLLEKQPTLTMDDAARTLGLARRTLQRRLRGEGTSFLVESRRARVRRAKYLLLSTSDKIAAIADAVGCATSQHFCELFRAETGVAPTEWREQVKQRTA